MSDLRTVKSPSLAAPSEVSMGDLRTAQTKSRRTTSAESTGDIIAGKYKITRRLGHGGMGVVYLALDQKLGREVTIKRLLSGADSANLGIELFLQEARAIAALNHRNIVTIFELGEDDRGPFIVMEYLSGGDLRKAIHSAGKMDTTKSLAIVKALGQGLAYAHGKGIIHRDIKPGNMLLDEDGTPKLVDFGLAQMGQESDLMVTGQGMGTMAYMAPEQLRDAKHIDARTDLYALAKTLYHMLTGEVPTTVDMEMVPAELRSALRQALKNKPEDRPASVVDFLKLLDGTSQPSTTATAPDTGVLKPGKCAGCGHQNPENARFCEGCGAGLFEPCPKCQAENRVGTKHCAACGTKVADFKSASEALDQAKELLKDHKIQQAIELIKVALAKGVLLDELRAVLKQAESIESQIQSLRTNAEQSAGQGKIEQAIQTLDRALAMEPQRKVLLDLREDYRNKISQRDVQGNLDAAKRSLQERRFDAAIQSCRAILKAEPTNAEGAALLSQAQAIEKDHHQKLDAAQQLKKDFKYAEAAELARALAAEYPLDEQSRVLLKECETAVQKIKTLVQEGRQSLKQKQFDKAIVSATALRQLKPDHPDIVPVLANAEKYRKDHQLRVDRVKQFRKGFRYAEAIELLRSLEADYPWDERLKKARIDFEGALKRIETLLQTARDDAAANRYYAVLEACKSIQQLKPDLPEMVALKQQAEAVSQDHVRRLAEAAQFKESFDFAKAVEVLRKLTADYAWDTAAKSDLTECESAVTQLDQMTSQAQTATNDRRFPVAITAWQSVLALNPTHTEAKGQIEILRRKLAARRLRGGIMVGVAAMLIIAATVVLHAYRADQQHLNNARTQLAAAQFDSARSELSQCVWFRKADKDAIARDVDRAELAAAVQQATADAGSDHWKDASDEFAKAEELAKAKGLALSRDQPARFAAALLDNSSRLASVSQYEGTVTCFKQAKAFSAAHGVATTRPTAIIDSLNKQSSKELAIGRFSAASTALESAGAVLGDPSYQKDQISRIRLLNSQSQPAQTAQQSALTAAQKAKAVAADTVAADFWKSAEDTFAQAQQALGKQQFPDAQSRFTRAAQQYDLARQRAEGIASIQSAKAAFDEAMKKYDADQLKKFGGDSWNQVASAIAEAEGAGEGFTKAVAAYNRAVSLLPDADAGAKAGMIAAKKVELLATARANDSPQNGKTALAALDDLLKIDPQNAEATELRTKIAGYYGFSMLADAVLFFDFSQPSEVPENGQVVIGMKSNDRVTGQVHRAVWQRGDIAAGFEFDGGADQGRIDPNSPDSEHAYIDLGTNVGGFPLADFSIEAWFVPKNDGSIIGSGQDELWQREWGLTPSAFWWNSVPGHASGAVGRVSNMITFLTKPNELNHLCVTRHGTTVIAYVNGVRTAQKDDFPATDRLPVYSYGLMIGDTKRNHGRYVQRNSFGGTISEVSVYSRALKEDEILQLYRNKPEHADSALVALGSRRSETLQPRTKSQAEFGNLHVIGMIGQYKNRRGPIPFINLSVPNGENVLNDAVKQAMVGKTDMDTYYFSFTAHGCVYIPTDGNYRVTAGRACDVTIDGLKYDLSNYGKTNTASLPLKSGDHDISLSVINNGGQLPEAQLAIVDSAGSNVPIFARIDQLRKALTTPIDGVKPIEVSGWKPRQVDGQPLAADWLQNAGGGNADSARANSAPGPSAPSPASPSAQLSPGLAEIVKQPFAEVTVDGIEWAPFAENEDLYRPKNNKNPQTLRNIPTELAGRTFTRFPMFNKLDGATLRFTVKSDGIVIMAFNGGWSGGGGGGGGRGGGDWQKECVSKETLAQQGWQSIGSIVDHDAFYRVCKAGETFSFRNNKYHPPILVR